MATQNLARPFSTEQSHSQLHPVFANLFAGFFPALVAAPDLTCCTQVNFEGEECGDPAVIQLLPIGDEALCAKHLRKANLDREFAELAVSRG